MHRRRNSTPTVAALAAVLVGLAGAARAEDHDRGRNRDRDGQHRERGDDRNRGDSPRGRDNDNRQGRGDHGQRNRAAEREAREKREDLKRRQRDAAQHQQRMRAEKIRRERAARRHDHRPGHVIVVPGVQFRIGGDRDNQYWRRSERRHRTWNEQMRLNQMTTAAGIARIAPELNAVTLDINSYRFTSDGLRTIVLPYAMSTTTIHQYLAQQGLRPASIEQLLAFAADHPRRRFRTPVVALGSPIARGTLNEYAYITRVGGQRALAVYQDYGGVHWSPQVRVLVYDPID